MKNYFNDNNILYKIKFPLTLIFFILCWYNSNSNNNNKIKPNIIWIYVEDISPDLSCYGNTVIKTPNIDKLADRGMKFTHAFASSSVCSPSRSAQISGMYQTTFGVHNHRSQTALLEKGGGNTAFYDSYKTPKNIRLLPKIFQDSGYYTVLMGEKRGPEESIKSDYNFFWDKKIYDAVNFDTIKKGQPFFAQIQLIGGKNRKVQLSNPVDENLVNIPPYYPDHPVIRKAQAEYLNAILSLDQEVGNIMSMLEEKALLGNTVIFFFSDHGSSHIRGKQFLYDAGINIPLIVTYPSVIREGSINNNLVSQIDITATSLNLAGIPIPEYMQGKPFLGENTQTRDYIYSARDRCDETVELIRTIRTKKFKYIRNYYPQNPHAQHNQYRDQYPEMKLMRQMFANSELDSIQQSLFQSSRPVEELYDLLNDPYEIHNLANINKYKKVLYQLQDTLIQEMNQIQDLGLIPEPELEELGKKYGSKYFILQHQENIDLIDSIRKTITYGEQGNIDELIKFFQTGSPSVKHWSAYGLSYNKTDDPYKTSLLEKATHNNSATVRVASARALCKLGYKNTGIPILISELDNYNMIIRLYAMLALEEVGGKVLPPASLEVIKSKELKQNEFQYVRWVAKRIIETNSD